ncbi:hypothetical protein WMY93_028374 [Mugilogobius chulae]|uniref:Uncharacterized protein n=1 Tax=Mugilogobius chulae TaxID=88201 RepID=A0AAW0MP68_9GOBI
MPGVASSFEWHQLLIHSDLFAWVEQHSKAFGSQIPKKYDGRKLVQLDSAWSVQLVIKAQSTADDLRQVCREESGCSRWAAPSCGAPPEAPPEAPLAPLFIFYQHFTGNGAAPLPVELHSSWRSASAAARSSWVSHVLMSLQSLPLELLFRANQVPGVSRQLNQSHLIVRSSRPRSSVLGRRNDVISLVNVGERIPVAKSENQR